jgi:hypothetical protein
MIGETKATKVVKFTNMFWQFTLNEQHTIGHARACNGTQSLPRDALTRLSDGSRSEPAGLSNAGSALLSAKTQLLHARAHPQNCVVQTQP